MSDSESLAEASPKTQRRIWRRVWIGVGVFVLVAPMLLWIAIDLAGKRAWREVQERLRAKGEATTTAELNLPAREDIPDAENFCALPWLIAKKDGSDSEAMIELEAQLEIFSGSREEPLLLGEAKGNPALGFPGSLSALARSLDLAVEELGGFEIDEGMMAEAGDDPAARIATYLNESDEFWKAADAASSRPHAYWLPMYQQRLAHEDGLTSAVSFPNASGASDLGRALAARISAALHAGDDETVLRSFEIALRLGEASSNEPNLIGGLVAQSGFAVTFGYMVECLWTDGWQRDAEKLERLQALIERWRVGDIMVTAVRGELVFYVEMLLWLRENRGGAARERAGLGGEGAVFSLVPPGWLDANAAYAADLLDRTILEAYRSGDDAAVLASLRRMHAETRGFNYLERMHRYLAILAFSPLERLVEQHRYWIACHRQALIACALYRYRLEHAGVFPPTLDALVPGYLDAVPADPIDGKPMRYAPTADASFELYSIGHDGHDDGGTLNLDPNRLERTRLQKSDYVGDWPWPVVPRELDQGGEENGGESH